MVSKITAILMAIVAFFSSFGFLKITKSEVAYDVQYGTHTRQTVDVSFPKENKKNQSAILFIHGGGWVAGNKTGFTNRAKSVSEKYECIAASMNHRYASENVNCNDILDDIDKALAKIKSLAAEKGITVKRVMLVGFSSGGHLAMMYAYTRKNTAPVKVAAVASYSGPTDISGKKFIEKNALADADTMRSVMSYLIGEKVTKSNLESKKDKLLKFSPVSYVTSSCVPTLVVQGADDRIVYPADTRTFVDKLKAKKVTYQYFELKDTGHQLDGDDEKTLEKSNEAFAAYVNKYLK